MSAEGRRGAAAGKGRRILPAAGLAVSLPNLGSCGNPRVLHLLSPRGRLCEFSRDLPAFGGVTLTRAISSVLAGRSHGSRRDKDARWLLCGWDVGIERSCDGPEPRCHPKSDRGGAHWRGDAQVGGKTR